MPATSPPSDNTDSLRGPVLARAAFAGVLMGLANLVPGISGGTMLLAAGVYTRFIDAVAGLSSARFERKAVLFLLVVVASAAIGIAALAGPVKDLVVERRWIMYSLFIGFTLGGIPALWRMARPPNRSLWLGAAVGAAAMIGLALAQQLDPGAAEPAGTVLPLVAAGFAGAAAMILPGVSGGYLLLLLGQYVRILDAIDEAVSALLRFDLGAMLGPVVGVFVPVAIGLLLGVAAVSNLLKMCLTHHREATLGVLLGLLAGVVVGLWPFQQGVAPELGSFVRGIEVTADNLASIDPEDWPVRIFSPSAEQMLASLGLIAAGFGTTLGISRLGRSG